MGYLVTILFAIVAMVYCGRKAVGDNLDERLAKARVISEDESADPKDRYKAGQFIRKMDSLPAGLELLYNPGIYRLGSGLCMLLIATCLLSTSIVTVDQDTTGHFDRKWFGNPLSPGEIISRTPMSLWSGTKGPQSEVVLPGTHFMLLQNVLYNRAKPEMEKMLKVPAGKFAVLVARDGAPMTGNRMLADDWPDEEFNDMLLNAQYFLNNGGMKGMQYTVVPSGSYHINNYLWEVAAMVDETKVGTGEVAVIRSNIQLDPNKDCTPVDKTTKVPLVPTGCRGVWAEELGQGTYRFNPRAVTPTIISVRQNTNDHIGGYERQIIAFSTDKEGNIVPQISKEEVPQGDAIDDAIDIRAEGWNIDQGVSTFWQIMDAPRAVADLGDQKAISQFVARITQSEFRIVAQGVDMGTCEDLSEGKAKDCMSNARRAMDLVYKRAEIEAASRDAIQNEIDRYGVKLNKVTMSRPNIPTELLMPVLRTQYAQKMRVTLEEEELTAQKRIAVQNANELANKQHILVTADLNNQAAAKQAEQIETLAAARKQAAFDEAEGQAKLLAVMGPERVQEQILVQKVLDTVKDCPECVKVPGVLVQGGGASNGVTESGTWAAVLGDSNIKAAIASKSGRTPSQ